ncbi:MAG: S8 family serine peptidase, partial [Blastochloris sp.]|nr:S8 family serine peptidase [Blastochloris sp.]
MMRMRMRMPLLTGWLALAFALAFALGSPPEPTVHEAFAETDEAALPLAAGLLERARAGEQVAVIVGLDVAFEPEARLAGVQAVQAQQAAIAQAQQAVQARLAAFALAGFTSVTEYQSIPYMALVVDEAALLALSRDPAVVSINEDYVQYATLIQSVASIGAPLAWDVGFTGAGWSIAVIDAGVEREHAFLAGKLVAEACFSSDQDFRTYAIRPLCPNGEQVQIGSGASANCPSSLDGCQHGTHVAGIAWAGASRFRAVAHEATLIA